MAAATALAVTSAAVGAGQMIYGAQQKKKAEAAADKAMAEQRALIEQGVVNQYAGLQAPTREFDIATQRTQANIADQTRMLQEMGPEGAANVGNLVLAGHQAELETAAKREAAGFEVDKLVASEQSRIDQMKYQGLIGLSDQELTGAQEASAYHREMFGKGLEGLSASFGQAAGIFGDSMSNNKG
jgi:hypothetical protein